MSSAHELNGKNIECSLMKIVQRFQEIWSRQRVDPVTLNCDLDIESV